MFRQGEYGMSVCVHDGVHLSVPETFAVGLCGTLVDACPVGDIARLGRRLPPCTVFVLQFMWHMLGQFSRRVVMNVVVGGLLADAYALLAQNAGYLSGRPVLFLNLTYFLFIKLISNLARNQNICAD